MIKKARLNKEEVINITDIWNNSSYYILFHCPDESKKWILIPCLYRENGEVVRAEIVSDGEFITLRTFEAFSNYADNHSLFTTTNKKEAFEWLIN